MILWTVLEICFDLAQVNFRPCSSYAAFELNVCFDCVRNFFSTVLEVRFDRAAGMFPRCSRYISTVLDEGFDSARGVF